MFRDQFQNYPGLRLQDLTYDDFQIYVQEELEDSPQMLYLVRIAPAQAMIFTHNIVEKVNGVFLWVKLVVWSLLDGLRNQDDIPELRERLNFYIRIGTSCHFD